MSEQYWIPHQDAIWLPGWFIREEDGSRIYQTDDPKIGSIKLPVEQANKLAQVVDTQSLEGVNDICSLGSVTEASLLHTVRTRYARDDIYTNISRILVAVNPFKPLNIYTNADVARYHNAKDVATLPPHIYGIAADAFTSLANQGRNQAVLISGESGAGKTESTKLVLLHIAEVLTSTEGGFEDKILEINPILEAFGNAKTVRNNNSSRFGKWIEVSISPVAMTLNGATITDYLLEVTRVCSQGPGERNYHIFYQLVKYASDSGDDAFQIAGGKFAYLDANPLVAPEIDDAENLLQMRRAFASLKFEKEEQEEIFRIVGGVLHLGNVTFEQAPEDERSSVVSSAGAKPLSIAANLFGCDEEALSTCMRVKMLVVGKEVTPSPQNVEQARQARDSVAKLLYSRLFRWLIIRCNATLGSELGSGDSSMPFIGVLDIAGFESFETNMLEQLFINLSNEKLQQFFNNTVFKSELADYKAEDINVGSIDFADNADVLALIEGKGGLLTMLDDATLGVKQTDAQYTAKIIQAHEKHARFIKPKFVANAESFGIRHFAGDVTYSTVSFLDKNFSALPKEVSELLMNSSSSVIRELALEPEEQKSGVPSSPLPRSAARKVTVSSAFRKSLNHLIDKLSVAEAKFVRCIKPNKQKAPETFDSYMVADQLRLSGVLEAVKIRQGGFPVRMPCVDFLKRYLIILAKKSRKKLLAEAGSQNGEISKDINGIQAAEKLLKKLEKRLPKMSPTDYAVGKTKIFIKDSLQRNLEQHRRLAFAGPALEIQAFYRGRRTRRDMAAVRECYLQMQLCMEIAGFKGQMLPSSCLEREDSEECPTSSPLKLLHRPTAIDMKALALEELISRAEGLSIKLPTLSMARKMRERMEFEAKLSREMRLYETSCDETSMDTILARAAACGMEGDLVDSVRKRNARLKEQLPHRRALQNCVVQELEDVQKAVFGAKDAGFDKAETWLDPKGPELYAAAVARLEQLEAERKAAEEAAKKAAEEAAAAEEARKKAEEERRQEALRRAEAIESLKGNITSAAAEHDANKLEALFREADQLGIPQSDTAEAHVLFMNLQNGDFVLEQLASMRKSRETHGVLERLIISNLSAQLGVLGLKVDPVPEMQEVVLDLLSNRDKSGRKSVHDTDFLQEQRLNEKTFEDLFNFSRLCDPSSWGLTNKDGKGRKVTDSRKITKEIIAESGPGMLHFAPERIPQTLTQLEPALEKVALQNFGQILRCMGDKASPCIGDQEEPIVATAKQSQEMCDEVYMQVMKQLNRNPSVNSAMKGWHLLQRLCSEVLPSPELCEFVYVFLRQRKEFVLSSPEASSSEPAANSSDLLGLAEVRQKGFEEMHERFAEKLREVASEAFEVFKIKRESVPAKRRETLFPGMIPTQVEIFTEDGMGRPIKVRDLQELAVLKAKMLKALALRNDDEDFYEFFLDSDDGSALLHLLPPNMTIKTANEEAMAIGKLVFGRVNVALDEDLPADNFPSVKFTFHHATQQFLKYDLPFKDVQGDMEEVVGEISAALLAVDRAIYRKKRKGRGHEKFNAKVITMKAEINDGLVGEGVLERYVPKSLIELKDRATWGKIVLGALERADAEEGGFDDDGDDKSLALVSQSHAVSLMQTHLPDFDAYVWTPVTFSRETEIIWDDDALSGSFASRRPVHRSFVEPVSRFELDVDNPAAEYRLLVTSVGMELRPVNPAGKKMKFSLKKNPGNHVVIGWHPLSEGILALGVLIWNSSGHTAMQTAILVPDKAARAITVLLMKLDSM